MGNKMCFCSCLPMTHQQKASLDDEDNQTFDYSPFKRTEIQRKQISKTKSCNYHNHDNSSTDQHPFTIFDKSLIVSNESISSLNRQSLFSSSSSSTNQLLDAGSLETCIDMVDTISIDSGICNSNRSSLSVIDDKQTLMNIYDGEVISKAASDLNLFKKSNNKTNKNIKKNKKRFNYNEDQTFLRNLKENIFLRVKECISVTYLMFSNNNHRQNQSIPHDLIVENVNNNNNNNTTNTNIEQTDAVLADIKRINSLILNSVPALCQFFLRVYDTNFF